MLRLAALLGAGTLGVHQGRYALGYNDHAAAAGHAYLGPVAALVAGTLALALAEMVRRHASGRPGGDPPSVARFTAACSSALLTLYSAQELIEGALSAHHPLGLATHGGWVAVPLALAAGFLIALIMRATTAVEPALRPWRAPAGAPLRCELPAPFTSGTHRAMAAPSARGPPLLVA